MPIVGSGYSERMGHISTVINVIAFPAKVAVAAVVLPFALVEAEERRQARSSLTFFPEIEGAACKPQRRSA